MDVDAINRNSKLGEAGLWNEAQENKKPTKNPAGSSREFGDTVNYYIYKHTH